MKGPYIKDMPGEVPQDLIEFAANTQREFEANRSSFPRIVDITQTTEGLIFHVLNGERTKIVSHSWSDIAKKRDELLREFLGEPAVA